MKKKLAILAGILVLSTVSFGNTSKSSSSKSSLDSSLNALENQLKKLEEMEKAKFEEQRALANAAQQRLDNYLAMQNSIDEKLAYIESNAEISIFSKEFKQKASEFKALKSELAKEISKEEKIIENFKLLESLR